MVVALVDGKDVGMGYGYYLDRFDQPKKELFIYSIDVLSDYQAQGIDKALGKAFLTPLNDDDFKDGFVLTHAKNDCACKLYESLGAKQINSDEGHDVLYEWTKEA